ncbi:MAG: 1,2-phenylacetyl-CoA epoxidase subunit PaaD [Geminicoccaceae bacterium]
MPATVEQVWSWLGEVPDPEIPAISVVDLGIVREVEFDGAELVVTVTPTYSGCPANIAIALAIEAALRGHGLERVRLRSRLSPPWTTDWISEDGKYKLRAFGIAPPVGKAAGLVRLLVRQPLTVPCARCGSTDTARISEFGSTPCKAQYRCRSCLEPFDYFKCH